MKPWKLLLLVCICLGNVCAAQADTLSLPEAVRIALIFNQDLAAARADVAVAAAKLEQVRSQGRLQAGLDFSFTHLEEAPVLEVPPIDIPLLHTSITLQPFALSKQDMLRSALSLQKILSAGGRIECGEAQVKEAVAALDARVEAKADEIALSTVKAYLGAVLAQRVAEVADQAYKTVEHHVAQAEAVFKAGMVPRYEVIRAQTELANQDRRRLDAHNQADLALNLLQDFMGVTLEETPVLSTSLSGKESMDEGLEEMIRDVMQSSPTIRALQARDRFYSAAAASARAERRPVIGAAVGLELYREDLPLTVPESYVGIMAKLPILDGGLSRAREREQLALKERNAADMQRLLNGLRLEVKKYYLDLNSARKALQAADKAVELASENLRLATRRFEVGEGTSLEKVDAVLALSLAETNREQACYQYDLSYYGLRKAAGRIRTGLDGRVKENG
jgi:outer membrane protein